MLAHHGGQKPMEIMHGAVPGLKAKPYHLWDAPCQKIKRTGIINTIIKQRAKGSETIATTTMTKLVLKCIDPDKYDESSPDDPVIIEKLKNLAQELGVTL